MSPVGRGIFLAVFSAALFAASARENNVCATFEGYDSMSDGCWHNPDVNADVPEILARYGYPMQSHETTTEDGYVLTMFRIPLRSTTNDRAKGVVFLEHPLSAYSAVWVDKGNQSLGFALSDAGYDVWMANARGTHHSLRHVNVTAAERSYWNFTFHEIGLYDLQAQFEYVARTTGRNDIAFIGHSMGSTSALIYASLRPEEAERYVKVFIAISPPAYFAHVTTPARYFVKIFDEILGFVEELGIYSLQHDLTTKGLFKALCLARGQQQKLCANVLMMLMGWNPKEINPAWVPVTLTQNPGGIGLKSVRHYLQQAASTRFRLYDHGTRANRYRYGSAVPPEYPVEKITVPFYLIYGSRDSLTSPKVKTEPSSDGFSSWVPLVPIAECVPEDRMADTQYLYGKLGAAAKIYGARKYDYNHVDFMYAKSAKRKLYDHIVGFLDDAIYR